MSEYRAFRQIAVRFPHSYRTLSDRGELKGLLWFHAKLGVIRRFIRNTTLAI